MHRFVALALVILAGCSNLGAKEEEKYELVVRQTATLPSSSKYPELCEQGKAVAQAYLNDRDEDHYKEWKLRSDIDCQRADLSKSYPL